jgi:hypothetical protein
VLTGSVRGDDTPTPDSATTDTAVAIDSTPVAIAIDTLLFRPIEEVSPAGRVTNPADLEQHLTQQPTVALFKSMFVPGWGQLGNRRYTKAFIFAGLETWFIASAVHYGGQANEAKSNYESATDQDSQWDYYSLYDNKRKNRNKFIWFAGLTAFVSMFDAYVDAHLSGSPAEPRNNDFTFDVVPESDGGLAAVLSYHF